MVTWTVDGAPSPDGVGPLAADVVCTATWADGTAATTRPLRRPGTCCGDDWKRLREAGYTSIAGGKWHLSSTSRLGPDQR